MILDPKIRATRLLSDAVSVYIDATKAVADATEHAVSTSTGRDTAARSAAYQALTELGARVRLAEKNLIRVAVKVQAILAVTDIENITKKLDKRESTESAWAVIKSKMPS